jgi:16S rRNA G527 N7-methylase RsmG
MKLTGLRELDPILKRHFLEPIAAVEMLDGQGRLLDLGSGNGFPAIPLAVLHAGVDLVLVEASEKKSSFLWAVVRALGLKSAQVATRRVCRRADLIDFLPSKWITYRGVKAGELLCSATSARAGWQDARLPVSGGRRVDPSSAAGWSAANRTTDAAGIAGRRRRGLRPVR